MKVLLADLSHSYSPSAMQSSYPSEDGDGFVVPLGIASIGAYAKKVFDDDIDIALFKFPDDLLNACDDCDIIPPDVIGFSNYVWNTHLNFTIGTELRKRFPNALFVAGGPSVQTDGNGPASLNFLRSITGFCQVKSNGNGPDRAEFSEEHNRLLSSVIR